MILTSKVGYLGPKGTFTKLAVDTAFNGVDTKAFKTIPECIDDVEQDENDIGVVPLENAIEGTVQLTIDYLVHQVRLPIFGELVVPIQQHLLARPDFSGDLSEIEEVHSHSHAIAQCHQYLHQNMPNADLRFRSSTGDRKSTRLNSSHVAISYAVFCLKKKTVTRGRTR